MNHPDVRGAFKDAAQHRGKNAVRLAAAHAQYGKAFAQHGYLPSQIHKLSPKARSVIDKMMAEGKDMSPHNLVAAMKAAGMSPAEIAAELARMGIHPDKLKEALASNGFSHEEVHHAMNHPDVKAAFHDAHHARKRHERHHHAMHQKYGPAFAAHGILPGQVKHLSSQAKSIIDQMLAEGKDMSPENMVAAMKAAGMSPAEIAEALAKLGVHPEKLEAAMAQHGFSAKQIQEAMDDPTVKGAFYSARKHRETRNAYHEAAHAKYGGAFAQHGYLPSQMHKLSPKARSIIDRMLAEGKDMSPENLVAAMKAAGMSPAEIAAELARMGVHPDNLRRAMVAHGYSQEQINEAFNHPEVQGAIHDAHHARLRGATSGITSARASKAASDAIAALQASGLPHTPANIIAALKARGLSPAEIMRHMISMGIDPAQVQSAMKQHGYSDHEIAKALADPSVQQAIQTASLQNPYAVQPAVSAQQWAQQFVAQAAAAGCAPCQAIAACQPGCASQPMVQPACGTLPYAAPQPVACGGR